MLKGLFKTLAVWAFVGTIFAHDDAVAAVLREQFTSTGGAQFFVRQATVADFDARNFAIGDGVRADRRARAENNIAGVYLVERALDGGAFEIVDRIFAGRMALGVQPATVDDGDTISFLTAEGKPDAQTEQRLSPIICLYEELAASAFKPVNRVAKIRTTTGDKVVLVTDQLHAMTVMLSGDYGTVSAQEAIVRLAIASGTKVPADSGVADCAIPFFCVSITKANIDMSAATGSILLPGFGYYAPSVNDMREVDTGLYNVLITPMYPDVVFGAESFVKSTALAAAYAAQVRCSASWMSSGL